MANNRLVAVVREQDSKNLIISFNSYSNVSFQAMDYPYSTKFENFALYSKFDATIMWFSEEFYSWYMVHEKPIIEMIVDFIRSHEIQSIKLIGMSSGGFAAIRFGAILNRLLDHKNIYGIDIQSFAINAQTGFRKELLSKISVAIIRENWTKTVLGENPPLLPENDFPKYDVHHPECDLRFVLGAHGFGQYRACLIYDRLNPVDRIFAEDLADFPQVMLISMGYATDHGSGCTRLSQEPALRAMLNAVLGLPILPNATASHKIRSMLSKNSQY